MFNVNVSENTSKKITFKKHKNKNAVVENIITKHE